MLPGLNTVSRLEEWARRAEVVLSSERIALVLAILDSSSARGLPWRRCSDLVVVKTGHAYCPGKN